MNTRAAALPAARTGETVIPTIEDIIAGLIEGSYTKAQASAWLTTHMRLAAETAPRGVEWPEQGRVQSEEFTWDFPLLHFGHGAIEVGDAKWEGLPCLFFGRDGLGMGVERDRNEPANDGETLALFTFANQEGLRVLEAAIARMRAGANWI